MKKSVGNKLIITILVLFSISLLSISFVSASWFGDYWNKITGKSIQPSLNEPCSEENLGFILGGRIIGPNSGQILITNSEGNTIKNIIPEFPVYGGEPIQQTSDGGYLVGFKELSSADSGPRFNLIKINLNLNVDWSKKSIGRLGVKSLDGGYTLVRDESIDWSGATMRNEKIGSSKKTNLVKINSEGDVEWDNELNLGESCCYVSSIMYSPNHDGVKSIKQTSDGGYILLWSSIMPGSYRNFIGITKTSSLGTVDWTRTLTNTSYLEYYNQGVYTIENNLDSIQQTSDGGYLLIGRKAIGSYSEKIWIVKTNSQGIIEWDNVYSGSGHYSNGAIQQTSDGGYILVGGENPGVLGSYDGWRWLVLKINSNGEIEWKTSFEKKGEQSLANLVQETRDGKYLVAGYIPNSAHITKINSQGKIDSEKDLNDTKFITDFQPVSSSSYVVLGYNVDYPRLIKIDDDLNMKWIRYFYISYAKFYSLQKICLKENSPTYFCYESDNGKDYLQKGTLTNNSGNFIDYCINSSVLFEFDCNDNNINSGGFYICPNGCIDGACTLQQNQTNQTLTTTTTGTTSSGGGGGGGSSAQTNKSSNTINNQNSGSNSDTSTSASSTSGSSLGGGSGIRIINSENQLQVMGSEGVSATVDSSINLDSSEGKTYIVHVDGSKNEIKVDPSNAVSSIKETVKSQEVKGIKMENYKDKVVYNILAEKKVKILALINSKMNINVKVDVETGSTVKIDKPWWSFAAKEI
jgi:hypothetical protein